MGYCCEVDYKVVFTSFVQKFLNEVCFAEVKRFTHKVKKIYYPAMVDKDLTQEQIDFYLNFLTKILNKKIFRFSKIKEIKRRHYGKIPIMVFGLDCKNLDKYRQLLYLTAFRYVQEFPEIIQEFYKSQHELDINKLFEAFCEIHSQIVKCQISLKKYDNLGGHGLMCPYGKQYVDLTTFLERLNSKIEKSSVNSYFYT